MFNSRRIGALASLVICLFIPVSAQQKNDRLQPMDIFNIQSVGDPQISPDGRKSYTCEDSPTSPPTNTIQTFG